MDVIVVTNPELGWNCVVGVYSGDTSEEDIQDIHGDVCVIHHESVQKVEKKEPRVDLKDFPVIEGPDDYNPIFESKLYLIEDVLEIKHNDMGILPKDKGKLNMDCQRVLAELFIEFCKVKNFEIKGEVVLVQHPEYVVPCVKFNSVEETEAFFEEVNKSDDPNDWWSTWLKYEKGIILH